MKTVEKIDNGLRNEQQFHDIYSFLENDLRIKQLENHDFIVPWQMVKSQQKKEVLVE